MLYQNRNQNQKPANFFKFADLLLIFSISISYLNYQQNVRQAETQKDISENLKKINDDGIIHQLIDKLD